MRPPIKLRITPRGAYGFIRSPTTTHYGADLGAPEGTVVVAPERLQVLDTAHDDNSPPPPRRWSRGYGPAVLLALGLDTGVVHVLAHLEEWSAADRPVKGQIIEEGAPVGRVSKLRHVHWEIRRADRAPWPRSRRGEDTIDPSRWLSTSATAAAPTSRPPPIVDVFTRAIDDYRKKEVDAAITVGIGLALLWLVSRDRDRA